MMKGFGPRRVQKGLLIGKGGGRPIIQRRMASFNSSRLRDNILI